MYTWADKRELCEVGKAEREREREIQVQIDREREKGEW